MSSEAPIDPSAPPVETALPAKESFLGMKLIFGLVFALIILAIFGGRPAWTAFQNNRAGKIAAKARELIKAERWDSAAVMLRDAMQVAPEAPEVLRTTADFLQKTNGDPQMRLALLRKLQSLNAATPADMVNYGEAQLQTGDTPAARETYEQLPTSHKQGRYGLELLAKILDDEGQKPRAMATLRQALLTEPDNPECQLRLAMLDLDQTFNETRRNAHETIWRIARQKDNAAALQAITFLASSKDLNAGEAENLRKTLAANPDAEDRHRFIVLSAYLRLFPTARKQLIEEEIAKYQGKGIDDMVPLLRWLVQEQQGDRVLGLVPKSLVIKSPDAFPVYAAALTSAGRWDELRKMLESRPPPPVSESTGYALLAECYAKLEPDLIKARHFLGNTYRSVGKTGEHTVALQAAQLAEKLGLWEIAAEGYEMIAQKNARMRVPMLSKSYEMALLAKNGNAMLSAAKRISDFRPDSLMYRARLDYLRLLLGNGIEEASASVLAVDSSTAEARAPDALAWYAVLRLLAAYRLGDPAKLRQEVGTLPDLEALPPGMRAVLAGLLQLGGGDATRAYHIAEKVPPAILLEEELRFLKLAL